MLTTRVHHVMTRNVVCVREHTPYKEIVRTLLEHAVSAVPVLDAQHRVLGMVSEADLMERQASLADGYPEARQLLSRRGRAAQAKVHALNAAALMTAPAITVSPGDDLAHAASLMRRRAVRRLAVVDAAGRPVGIVSRSDLLKPYLRSDDGIRAAVVQHVIVEEMCTDPRAVRVDVRDGVVTLSGEMENEFVARDTAHLVRELDGVVEVVDHLRYRIEDRPAARVFRTPA